MKTLTILIAVAATLLFGFGSSSAASLADFGHGTMLANGKPALGARKLLVIKADIMGDDSATHSATYYDNLVFSSSSFPSVNGFMLENSVERFVFVRAGTGMVDMIDGTNFTDAERADLGNDTKRAGHCINAAARAGFKFADMDANNDGTITLDELTVLIVDNSSLGDSGAVRWANPDGTSTAFTIQGSTKKFQSVVALVTQNISFASLAHELTHLLGMIDLYGVWSQECMNSGLTIASCTLSGADNPDTYHLDPWHKMRLGWGEPRIVDMRSGGVATLAANQGTETDKHLILHDSARGTEEFFMLEYRTRNSGGTTGYDDDVNDSGLVIWHIQQDAAHNAVIVGSPYVTDGVHAAVWAETPTDLRRGGGKSGPAVDAGAWHSGATTPTLKWLDGSLSPSHIVVRPFAANATSITIEILSTAETWVDFNFVSAPPFIPELGTFELPHNTLWEGVNAAAWGGTVNFKSGHTLVTGTITKPLELKAWNGLVTLGN